jgi:hypothetical protein
VAVAAGSSGGGSRGESGGGGGGLIGGGDSGGITVEDASMLSLPSLLSSSSLLDERDGEVLTPPRPS